MTGSERAKEIYLTGLRNQHGVEAQAIETIERELGARPGNRISD
ncbi:hypothetical protein GCM10011504_50250 [Siccirubricoccus deserti]|nr:hypothetical protein [Siccirubricoccus deserti]GGC66243.1 hypothetical protein GCM10011504_50250 [Siccirubricoccus deserti]